MPQAVPSEPTIGGQCAGGSPRWRVFDYDELDKRDKANLDIFWLKDKSLADSEDLPEPNVLAQEIADDLQTVLVQIASIAAELKDEQFIAAVGR